MSDEGSPVSSRTRSKDVEETPRVLGNVEGDASLLGEASGQVTPRVSESISLSPFGGSGRDKDSYYLRLGKECGLKGVELANYVLESLNKELELDAKERSEAAMAQEQAKCMREELRLKQSLASVLMKKTVNSNGWKTPTSAKTQVHTNVLGPFLLMP